MIRLHRLIERSRRHRVLFLLVLLLLGLLLALVAAHSVSDTAAPADGGLVCVFVALLIVAIVRGAPPASTAAPARPVGRAPPPPKPLPPPRGLRPLPLLAPLRL